MKSLSIKYLYKSIYKKSEEFMNLKCFQDL
jgi:hypothetical protein